MGGPATLGASGMAKRDYYEVLGVQRDVDAKALKNSFRSLARKYHPDKNDSPDADEKFKEIQEAFAVLSNSEKRQVYDQYGHKPPGGSPFGSGGFSGFNMNFDDIFSGDLGDLFGSFFGGSSRRRHSTSRGNDILVRHIVPFQSIFDGSEEEVEIDLPTACEDCEGSGAMDPDALSSCQACGGRGQVTVREQMGPFINQSTRTCGSCSGRGQLIDEVCEFCDGHGRVQKEQKLRFNVPKGASDGTRLRMRGSGEPAPMGRGEAGDLYIELRIEEHPWFERDGADLLMSMPIGYPDFALGRTVSIPHFDGKDLEIKIPAGSRSGQTLEIAARGLADARSRGRGNVIVLLKMYVPKKLSRAVKKGLEGLRKDLSLDDSKTLDEVRNDADDRRSNH